MQHILRCWERQSDGTECKKTLRRTPDPAGGAYSAPANPLVGGEGLAVLSPRTPSPALGPSGLASPTPTPKLVPTPLHRPMGSTVFLAFSNVPSKGAAPQRRRKVL